MTSRHDNSTTTLPLDCLQRLDAACLRFEDLWLAGDVPQLEEFFDGLDGVERVWLLHELLRLDLDYRRRGGQRPKLVDYTRRFPMDAAVVESVFASHAFDGDTGDAQESVCGGSDSTALDLDATSRHGSLPRSFGDYQLSELLGEGGMGVVYRAVQRGIGRVVALKIIRPDRLRGAIDRREKVYERFQREARAAARLEHPNIVRVYEVGQVEGRPYYSMEYVAGRSLQEVLKRGPLDGREAAALLEPVARAVHYAHERQIVHRDLKPRNILVTVEGPQSRVRGENVDAVENSAGPGPSTLDPRPRITDFGLARLLDDSSELTQTGEVLGTPAYMSPEQALGRAVDHTTDIYSLGATLYEALAGRPPFQAATIAETQRQVIESEPVPLRRLNPAVNRDLETVCLKCLEKQSAGRYATAAELADDLKRYLDGSPVLARPLGSLARSWRWCRRRPGWAALWAATTVMLLVLSIGGPLMAWHQAALRRQTGAAFRKADAALVSERQALSAERAARRGADRARGQAEFERQRAADELLRAEWLLYASRIAATRRAWEAGDARAALESLESTQPQFRGWEYDFWHSHFTREHRRLEGHTHYVSVVEFSRDGRWLLTAGWDKSLRVWDVESGRVIRELRGSGAIYSAAFNLAGDRIAAAGYDGTVTVWAASVRKPLWTGDAHRGRVFSVAFSPGGQELLSAGDDGIVRIWDATTGDILRKHATDGLAIRAAAFTPDGGEVIAAAGAGDIPALRQEQSSGAPRVEHEGLVWWDSATGRVLRRVPLTIAPGAELAVSPDGESIALANGSMIAVYQADDGVSVQHWILAVPAISIAWNPDSRRIVAGDGHGKIQVFDTSSGRLELALVEHPSAVHSVAFSPDGQSVASGGQDRTARLWNVGSSRQMTTRQAAGPIRSIACSPDGRRIAAGTYDTAFIDRRSGESNGMGSVSVWDLSQDEPLLEFVRQDATASGIALHPQRDELYAGWSDHVLTVSNLANTGEIQTLRGHAASVHCLALSPDGRTLASGAEDGEVKLWETATGRDVRRITQGRPPVWSMVFTPDGGQVVFGDAEGRINFCDSSSGGIQRVLEAHDRTVTCLAVSRQWLASGGRDRLVKLWDARQGTELQTLRAHTGSIIGVAFTPDASRVASIAADGTLRLWDTATGQQTMVLRVDGNLFGGGVVFSSDGRHLIAAGGTGRVRIWELEGAPMKRVLHSAEFTPTTRTPSNSAD